MSIRRDTRRLAEMLDLAEQAPNIVQKVRDKLREIVSGVKHRFASRTPEDLADDLDALLQQASLAKQLSTKQYTAVANVWDMLGSDMDEVEAAAGRALMLTSEEIRGRPKLGVAIDDANFLAFGEGKSSDVTKTLESIQRWLRGSTPTVNSYAKKFAGLKSTSNDQATRAEITTVSDTLQQIATLLTTLDISSKKALGGK